jgi:hypothetical protein
LTDSAGNSWTLTGGLIYQNGTLEPSGDVILLEYCGGLIYQENASSQFWEWSNNTWASTAMPNWTVCNQIPAGIWENVTLGSGDGGPETYWMVTTGTGTVYYGQLLIDLSGSDVPPSYFGGMFRGTTSLTLSSSGNTVSISQYQAFGPLGPELDNCESYCQAGSTPYTLTGVYNYLPPPDNQPLWMTLSPAANGYLGGMWDYSNMTYDGSSLATLTGTWQGSFNGGTVAEQGSVSAFPLVIAADGTFTQADTGSNCLVTGEFSIPNTGLNLYTVTWNYSGSSCLTSGAVQPTGQSLTGVSGNGMAYIDYSADPIELHIDGQLLGPLQGGPYFLIVAETQVTTP